MPQELQVVSSQPVALGTRTVLSVPVHTTPPASAPPSDPLETPESVSRPELLPAELEPFPEPELFPPLDPVELLLPEPFPPEPFPPEPPPFEPLPPTPLP